MLPNLGNNCIGRSYNLTHPAGSCQATFDNSIVENDHIKTAGTVTEAHHSLAITQCISIKPAGDRHSGFVYNILTAFCQVYEIINLVEMQVLVCLGL